jgi:hypothetical protein
MTNRQIRLANSIFTRIFSDGGSLSTRASIVHKTQS